MVLAGICWISFWVLTWILVKTTHPETKAGVWVNSTVLHTALCLFLLIIGFGIEGYAIVGHLILPFFVSAGVCFYCLNKKRQGGNISNVWFVSILAILLVRLGIVIYKEYLDRQIMNDFKVLQERGLLRSGAMSDDENEYPIYHDVTSMGLDDEIPLQTERKKEVFAFRDLQFEAYTDWDITTESISPEEYTIMIEGEDFYEEIYCYTKDYDVVLCVESARDDILKDMGKIAWGDVFDTYCGQGNTYVGEGFFFRDEKLLTFGAAAAFLLDSRTLMAVVKTVAGDGADLEASELNLIDSTLVYVPNSSRNRY